MQRSTKPVSKMKPPDLSTLVGIFLTHFVRKFEGRSSRIDVNLRTSFLIWDKEFPVVYTSQELRVGFKSLLQFQLLPSSIELLPSV